MDEIQALIDMRNNEIKRLARIAYFVALSQFQKLIPAITKDKNVRYDHKDGNGETNYDYATLGHEKMTISEAMAECGFAADWKTRYDDKGRIFIKCINTHAAGHSEEDELMGFTDTSGGKNTIQAMRSTVTYLRRAALESVLGLATKDDDDDGRKAPREPKKSKTDTPGTVEFNKILTAYISGRVTLEELKEKYSFTEDQLENLKKQ